MAVIDDVDAEGTHHKIGDELERENDLIANLDDVHVVIVEVINLINISFIDFAFVGRVDERPCDGVWGAGIHSDAVIDAGERTDQIVEALDRDGVRLCVEEHRDDPFEADGVDMVGDFAHLHARDV